MPTNMEPRLSRRLFFTGLGSGIKVVWPILSALLGGIMSLGAAVALLEDWPLSDGIYFAFVTGLTIGYGDLVPHRLISRMLSIGIGLLGMLMIALLAAIAVRAMESMNSERGGS
jgi:hypothetical protein